MGKIRIDIPREKVAKFCKKWEIAEFAFFGSVLRKDFYPDSDIDVLVTFNKDAKHTLFDLVNMENELKDIFAQSGFEIINEETIWKKPKVLFLRCRKAT